MEIIRVEVEIEDRQGTELIEVEGGNLNAVLAGVRTLAALEDVHVFERDADETIGVEIEQKKALSIIAHRCKRVHVKVQYDHRTEPHEFAPSATVFRVLQWAAGKKGFKLDDAAKAKANLILPGADQPLPKDAAIGRYVKHHDCELTLDLTLKDFTNG